MNLHFFLLHFLTYRATIAGVAFTLYSDANQFFWIFLLFVSPLAGNWFFSVLCQFAIVQQVYTRRWEFVELSVFVMKGNVWLPVWQFSYLLCGVFISGVFQPLCSSISQVVSHLLIELYEYPSNKAWCLCNKEMGFPPPHPPFLFSYSLDCQTSAEMRPMKAISWGRGGGGMYCFRCTCREPWGESVKSRLVWVSQSEQTQTCHTGAERWSVSVNVIDRDMVH